MPLPEPDRAGRSPLHYVAVDLPLPEHAATIRRMVEEGANLDLQDKMGCTALHFAAQEWSEPAAQTLLELGASVDVADKFGKTPLHVATFNSRGRGDLITLLLNAGADPDRENESGISPRDLANTIANYDVAQWFSRA